MAYTYTSPAEPLRIFPESIPYGEFAEPPIVRVVEGNRSVQCPDNFSQHLANKYIEMVNAVQRRIWSQPQDWTTVQLEPAGGIRQTFSIECVDGTLHTGVITFFDDGLEIDECLVKYPD